MKKAVLLILAGLAIGAFALWFGLRSDSSGTSSADGKQGSTDTSPNTHPAIGSNNEERDSGGNLSSRDSESKISPKTPSDSAKTAADSKQSDPFNYGKTPLVRGDTNEQVNSVVQAVKKGNAEQLSVLTATKPFNPEEYRANPSAYLNTPTPSRCFQPAQPTEKTPRIQALGETRLGIKQGESVVLRVKAVPGYPVTWTSFDLGKFHNELTTVSVEANADGIAEATFSAPPGTINNVQIVCAAPMASGTIRYSVKVSK